MSSDQEVIDEAKAIVDDLINPETLSILDWVENVGTVLPEKTLTFYLDLAAAVELKDLQAERDAEEVRVSQGRAAAAFNAAQNPQSIGDEEPEVDMGRLAEIDAKIDVLRAKATKSGLVFHLRGVRPRTQQEIEERVIRSSVPDDDKGQAIMFQLTAKNLVKVEIQATGKVLTEFNAAIAERLIKSLPAPDVNRLFDACRVLNTAAVVADPRVDAGFPGEPVVPAEEPGDADRTIGGTGVGD